VACGWRQRGRQLCFGSRQPSPHQFLTSEAEGGAQGLGMLKQFRIADQEIAEAIIGKCLVLLRQRAANEERSVERVVAVRVERRKERQRGQQILLHVQFERTYHPSKDAEARQQEQEALVQLRQGGIVCVLCVRDQLRRVERGDGL